VTVEVHLSGGLPALSIVGLPETAVKESKERVRAALLNAGFEFPARRITVNLAPAELDNNLKKWEERNVGDKITELNARKRKIQRNPRS
jgi:hypothetical protein